MSEIKGLTLWQPWASLVSVMEKQIETRSWATDYRGYLAIHAAKRTPKYAAEYAHFEPFYSALKRHALYPDRLPSGAIVAVCRLEDCMQITSTEMLLSLKDTEIHFGDHTVGRYAWMLGNFDRLEKPIPIKGGQRLWNLPPAIYDILISRHIRPLYWCATHQLEHYIEAGYKEDIARLEWKVRFNMNYPNCPDALLEPGQMKLPRFERVSP